LDVTANNIANVNTVAFKAGRATFKESMVQMLQGPSRPAGNQGGRNPMQLGLGVAVGSIDTMLRQGNLQTTGQITDLALEGRAYFAFSSGNATFYSRNGGLQMDSHGYLVSPTNGWRLQGKMAGPDGTYDPNAMIGDLRIPWGDKAPAKATDMMSLACNLNSDSHALGTVTHTNRFLASAGILAHDDPTNPSFGAFNRAKLTDLFDVNGNSLGIKEGDTLSFSVANPNVPTFRFAVEKITYTDSITGETLQRDPTLNDLRDALERYLNGVNYIENWAQEHHGGLTGLTVAQINAQWETFMNANAAAFNDPMLPMSFPGVSGNLARISVNVDPTTGGLSVFNPSLVDDPLNPGTLIEGDNGNITGLQVRSSRPGSNSFVANAFLFPANIRNEAYSGDGSPADPFVPSGNPVYTTPGIRIPAVATDLLANLFDASGRELGFTHGDTVTINGMVGGRNRNVAFTYQSDTTMADLMANLAEAFGLPPTDGTIYNRPSVTMKDSNDLVNDGIPLGSIVLRGQPEVAFSLTGLSVIGKQADPNQELSPTRFNTNMVFIETQTARNTGVWTASEIVFDESGAEHNVAMTFTHTGTPGEWLWEITTLGGDQVILGGNRGRITFALDGSPSSFTFDDGSNEFRFDPRNGANEVSIRLDVGTPSSFLGITQFKADSTTTFKSQNGYGMGKLSEITIDENGEISGIYTNGISRAIAQIYVAEFNNPAGLLKMGDSMFAVSNNSGGAAMFQPNVGSTTKIKPGALEMSNVELETEFTNMITIQRGYQASARVISTSDQMLQELVQLVR
jgi:flagellar hook protein FlgE